MPTYEYLCSAGHRFEQVQRMSEPPVETCPTCGAPAQRQLSGGTALLFKGSGFYITDYRSDSYKKAAEADKGDAKPAAEKSDKTDKPADKPKASGSGGDAGAGSKAE
jgi:putative FmdB family regulatory protein